jgi:hypothetical protein
LVIGVAASAIPSINPTDRALAPRAVTKKTGSRLWIISEEISMNRDTKPSATTVRGMPRIPVIGCGLASGTDMDIFPSQVAVLPDLDHYVVAEP